MHRIVNGLEVGASGHSTSPVLNPMCILAMAPLPLKVRASHKAIGYHKPGMNPQAPGIGLPQHASNASVLRGQGTSYLLSSCTYQPAIPGISLLQEPTSSWCVQLLAFLTNALGPYVGCRI